MDKMLEKKLMDHIRCFIGKDPEELKEWSAYCAKHVDEPEKHLLVPDKKIETLGDYAITGTIALSCAICYGTLTSMVWFRDGAFNFKGSFWGGGAASVGGAGVGAWGDGYGSPSFSMDFSVASVAIAGGIVNVFWWEKDRPIQGGIAVAGAGLALVGGKGEGIWNMSL